MKAFKDDPTKTWEERFKLLEDHHKEETTLLIERIKVAEKVVELGVKIVDDYYHELESYNVECLKEVVRAYQAVFPRPLK